MFYGERWAVVFINALGENAEEGLVCLNAMVPSIKSIPGPLFGKSAARGVEKILRGSVAACSGVAVYNGAAAKSAAVEYAVRLIVLLVEKNLFRNIDSLLEKIERRLNEQKGALDVTVELAPPQATPADSAFQKNLERQIAERIGIANVKMKTKIVPELLGGYRLRIGGFYVDASLKGQLERMTSDLRGGM